VKIDVRIHKILAFLMIFQTTLLALDILSNNAFAQTTPLHDQTLYEVVKQTSGLQETSQIDVGIFPVAIDINRETGTVYVANFFSNTVSVISAFNNAKIGEDIPVGEGPGDIAIDENTNTVYVVNAFNNTISVISGENNTKIKDIPVGEHPAAIGVTGFTDRVYVANSGSDSVSVISVENNTKIGEDIPVGDIPTAIGVNDLTDTVYVANSGSNTTSVISVENNTKIKDIPVGGGPRDIGVIIDLNTVYVANSGSDSVSVISAVNNTKIGEDIPVGGGPIEIGIIGPNTSPTVYVVNVLNNTISVISAVNNTKIGEDIPVGGGPTAIGVISRSGTIYVYVANTDSDSVSVISAVNVISGENNTKIKDIPVGEGPRDIGVMRDTVYVANSGSSGVSVIEGVANEVVTGITFQVKPFNSGYIVCYDLTTPSPYDLTPPSPIERYVYIISGTECIARPNEGFEFLSWEENLGGNATQLINISRSASPWDSFVLTIGAPFGYKPDKPEATLPITKFGTFTANFKELPPAFPSEYLIPLYGIIISTIVGWSIPSIISWTKSKKDVRKLNYYHKQIASLYADGRLDENDIGALDKLRGNIVDAYSEGKINEKHYENLKNEISVLYEKIFRKRLNDTLKNNDNNPANKKATQEQLAQIRSDVKYAYSEGKINEKHYDLLNEDISNLGSK
jgi:YVTN family beta-propeller protein